MYIPPLEKDELLLDIRSACRVESAKAVVDDTYLGYIQQRELRQLLDEFALDAEGKEGGAAGCHGCALSAIFVFTDPFAGKKNNGRLLKGLCQKNWRRDGSPNVGIEQDAFSSRKLFYHD